MDYDNTEDIYIKYLMSEITRVHKLYEENPRTISLVELMKPYVELQNYLWFRIQMSIDKHKNDSIGFNN